MTREQRIKKFDKATGWVIDNPIEVIHFARKEFIEAIKELKELENRTCESCKYKQEEYTIDDRTLNQCVNENSLMYMTDLSDTDKGQSHSEWGCNGWETKRVRK